MISMYNLAIISLEVKNNIVKFITDISKIKYIIYKGGSLWIVVAKKIKKEGKRNKQFKYQLKKGNIPNLRKILNKTMNLRSNKKKTIIQKEANVW